MPRFRFPPVNVLVIGEHQLVRSGLTALLRGQPQIRLVGEREGSGERARADVLVWHVGSERPRAQPSPFVAVLADPRDAPVWLGAGAGGIVLETSPLEQLLDAIRQVGRGQSYVPAELALPLLTSQARAESPAVSPQGPAEPLTDRESDVLRLLAQGLSNKDLAQRLYLSVRTVEGHLAHIYGKIGVRSRTEAALWALRNLS